MDQVAFLRLGLLGGCITCAPGLAGAREHGASQHGGSKLPPPSAQAVLEAHPGVQSFDEPEHLRAFFGKHMTRGATPKQAADRWLVEHGDALTGGAPDLRLIRST